MASRFGLGIRALAAADAPGLAALMEAAGHPVGLDALAARVEALRPDQGTALVAIEWGPPSGLVVAHWLQTLAADLPVAHVSTLLVGPDERRRGIGRTLLKAVSQAARLAGCGSLHLRAPPDDTSLSHFCRAAGFDETGRDFTRPLRKRS